MDYFHYGRVHSGSGQIIICTNVNVFEWLAQHLSFLHINSDKFKNSVLGDDTDYHCAVSLVVIVNNRNTPRPRGNHHPTGFVERLEWMYRNSFNRRNTNRFLDFLAGQLEMSNRVTTRCTTHLVDYLSGIDLLEPMRPGSASNTE